MKNIGLYVHIPFCKSKCKYCDFISYANKEDLIKRYVNCLKQEIKNIAISNLYDYKENKDDLIKLNTIYIGGGTPSFIDSKYIREILGEIKNNYNISENAEITIEVNPGTVSISKLEDYKNAGINRLSIGLQTTNNDTLKKIGRIHTYEEFLNTYNMARDFHFDNINIDLMIALPGQTLEELEKGVDRVIKLNPEHISLYSLILEEGTELYNEVNSGKLMLVDDDLERKMYWKSKQKLEKAGYVHYEISNFAKKGFESKHNLSCWNDEEYIGVGAAAHSYTNGVRYSNIDNIEDYISNYENGRDIDNFVFHEKLDKKGQMMEFMMLGLRKIKGVRIVDFEKRFSENPLELYEEKLIKLKNEKLIDIDNESIKLSKKGLDLANLVWEEFV